MLIHLDEYFDWNSRPARVSPVHRNFKWIPGVMNVQGLAVPGHSGGCRGLEPPLRRDQDSDDDHRGHRSANNLLPGLARRAAAAHGGAPTGVNGVRHKSRSPTAGRRQHPSGADGHGREQARSPVRLWRPQDPQRRNAEDWQRRRSRSPSRRSPVSSPGVTSKLASTYYGVKGLAYTAPSFGSLNMHALAARDAPSPPKQHPDPLLDFFTILCTEPFPADAYRGLHN